MNKAPATYAATSLEAACLDNVMTSGEIEEAYALPVGTVKQAVKGGRVIGRKSGQRGWLVLRSEAERYWGKRRARPAGMESAPE